MVIYRFSNTTTVKTVRKEREILPGIEENVSEVEDESSAARSAAERLLAMPMDDIGFFDIKGYLVAIEESISGVSDADKPSVRKALKKVLLTLPPWDDDAIFINEKLGSLVYGQEELRKLQELKNKSARRLAEIERDIKDGASAWWAHVKHNERSPENPLTISFYRDPDGRIRTLYGQRCFRSERQVQLDLFQERSETKEVCLLSTRFEKVKDPEILRSPLYDDLPDKLKKKLEQGEILVTAGVDLYDIDEDEIEALASRPDLDAPGKLVDKKISEAGSKDDYYLLYYADYQGNNDGRTGVLMTIDDNEAKPVLFEVDGEQYILEIKGCGKRNGGFSDRHYRTGQYVVTGGAEREQAQNEFTALSQEAIPGGPKAVAAVLFGEQGYILRLAPSTVRASYSGNDVYPEIKSPEQIGAVIDMYAEELSRLAASPNPRIPGRSAHPENILLWGTGDHVFTDFSDHILLSGIDLPRKVKDKGGGYLTPKKMVEFYMRFVDQISGYRPERDMKSLFTALETSFQKRGIDITLDKEGGYAEAAEVLWEKVFAYKIFSARQANGYRPRGVLRNQQRVLSTNREILALDTEQSFKEKLEGSFRQAENIPDLLRESSVRKEELEAFALAVQGRNLPAIIELWKTMKHADKELRALGPKGQAGIEAILELFYIQHTLTNNLSRYLEEEEDLVRAAAATAKGIEILEVAKEEIAGKKSKLAATMEDPEKMWRLTDARWVENFLNMRFYYSRQAESPPDAHGA